MYTIIAKFFVIWSILRFRTNRIESNFKVIRFDSIRSSFNSIRFELKKTGFKSIRILKKNFNVILIFVSFKFQYNKKFKLILYYYYSDDQTDESEYQSQSFIKSKSL